METTDVAVVGGGLAGISTALSLTRAGHSVALYERAPRLGGRAGSHPDRQDRLLDTGQHVYMGCFTAYRSLLEGLGVTYLAPLERRLSIALVDPRGRTAPRNERKDRTQERSPQRDASREARLESAGLPYPLSLAGAVLRYTHLSLRERVSTLAVMRHALREYRNSSQGAAGRPRRASARSSAAESEEDTFDGWLRRWGVSENSREALWEPLILATLNSRTSEVRAHAGLMVIARALCGGRDAAAVGLPRAPLTRLLEPAADVLRPRGRVHVGTPVHKLVIEGGRTRGLLLADGNQIRCRAVVLATSHLDVAAFLPPAVCTNSAYFNRLRELKTRPIVNVHLWYDREITPGPMVGIIHSPLQWLFNLTVLHDENPSAGCHYSLSLSGADEYMERDADSLSRLMAQEMHRVFHRASPAHLLDSAVRKMRHATFSCAPGCDALRPANQTPIPGLFLAGDYTDTGWPATMESAVRSGGRGAEIASDYVRRSAP